MTFRWLTCIAVSLGVHIAGLWCCDCLGRLQPTRAAIPVVVAKADLASLPPEVDPPISEVRPPNEIESDAPAAADPADRFRPNVEPEEPAPEPIPEPEDSFPEEQGETGSDPPATESTAADTALSPEERNKAIEAYRHQLMGQFKDQWQEVPELNTVVEDVTLLPEIDGQFSIVVLAYSFVDHKPGPPFLLFNMQNGSAQKIDRFDFAGFSNRIKDRMLYAQYRSRLDEARREYDISSLMKVIGLVPTEVDRYFCSKQLRAIQLAHTSLDQVRTTNGHYEPGGAGGFNLIIDSVITKDGRTIDVQDEELKFSVGAGK